MSSIACSVCAPSLAFFRSFQVVAQIMAAHDVEQLERSSSSASATSTTASPQPLRTGASVVDQALVTYQARPGSRQTDGRASVNAEIDRLLVEQKRIKQEKKEMSNLLKNAQRRRKRLKHKARLLSQQDLMEVMMLRSEEEAGKRARTDEDPVELAPAGAADGEARAPSHADEAEEQNSTP